MVVEDQGEEEEDVVECAMKNAPVARREFRTNSSTSGREGFVFFFILYRRASTLILRRTYRDDTKHRKRGVSFIRAGNNPSFRTVDATTIIFEIICARARARVYYYTRFVCNFRSFTKRV